MKHKIPKSHPRYESLITREMLVEAFEKGVVVPQGLIAHGRGECFDYLIGERTIPPADEAAKAAAAALLLAEHPIISVNGNTAALAARDVVRLAEVVGAGIEVNLFYRSREREEAIARVLRESGAAEVLGVGEDASATIPELHSERRRVSPRGILVADVVLVPLEDGDRVEALERMGKRTIVIDLNPLSRSARMGSITVVDNVIRAIPNIARHAEALKGLPKEELERIVEEYDNNRVLGDVLRYICGRLRELSRIDLKRMEEYEV